MARQTDLVPDDGGVSPAGAPAEQRALDRPWRLWASIIVAGALLVGALIGFVLIPAGQAGNANLSLYEAVCRALGIRSGSPAQVQPVSSAVSVPVSEVSWDPAVMRILAEGNSRRGAAIAAQTCASCHGDKGLSQSDVPALAGQSPYAIYKQLADYRSGARAHPQMTGVAKALSVPDLAAVSAYFAAASKEYAAIGARDLVSEVEIERLAREGNSRRRIPACLSCHLNGVGGPIETPVIIGQNDDYLLAQMNAYASGQRRNDVYGRMRDISAKLTPAERAALARYFQGTL
ncbi:c-type cytochrome [Sphingomonas mesophila]|uniref:c-type cytochrome n=1 Tax=Sphingomonas mesophila TaxID=2303576 RepID=UPI000E590BCD|nr:c-type cytochrome [Sphingomonas mesophila]